ncbi:hypothetical protein [Actinacidiphila yeochonensis]|uniref:hypothetical protein n=1 Tax=Actinacidiphila yeochonensis TaxID=89050 RepID=UPI000561CE2C|nr:hypothetical protein [Actinacidiphila yeochonensis]
MLLPPTFVDTELVEVVHITDLRSAATHYPSRGLIGDTVAIWAGEEAAEALSLITGLAGGDAYRCFVPRWGIRAHGATSPLFEIAFCFRCQATRGRRIDSGRGQFGEHFDAASPAAVELLRRFDACLPD